MKTFISFYSKLSPLIHASAAIVGWVTPQCRFQPTCSAYAHQALEKYGPVKGLYKTVARVIRCNPLSNGGIDLP